jgi:hypothetical protein
MTAVKSASPRPDRDRLLVLGAVLSGSALLRFWGLSRQGLYLWDEVYLADHARIFADFFRAAAAGGPALYAEVARTGGLWHGMAAKPAHYALMTAAALVGGGANAALQAVSAACGLATVVVAYLWGRRWSETAGLCAAALLGSLGGHVWYSRGLLATAPASLLLFLGAYAALELEPTARARLAAGAALGLAVGTHYSVLPAAAAVLAFAAWRGGARGAALTAAGLLLVLCGLESCYLLRNAASPRPMPDYFGELLHYLFGTSRRDPAEAWKPALLLRWLALSSGAPAAAALVCGTAALALRDARRRARPEALLVLLGAGMFAFWSVAFLWWAQVARPIGAMLPFLCLGAGVGLARAVDGLPRPRGAAAGRLRLALPLALFAAGLPYAVDYAASASPYAALGARLRAAGPGASAATWNTTLVLAAAPTADVRSALDPRAADAGLLIADFRAPARAAWPPALSAAFAAQPESSYELSRFDPRVVCLEEDADPAGCASGARAFLGRVDVFARAPR